MTREFHSVFRYYFLLHLQKSPEQHRCRRQKLFYLGRRQRDQVTLFAPDSKISLWVSPPGRSLEMGWIRRYIISRLQYLYDVIAWWIMHEVYHVKWWLRWRILQHTGWRRKRRLFIRDAWSCIHVVEQCVVENDVHVTRITKSWCLYIKRNFKEVKQWYYGK